MIRCDECNEENMDGLEYCDSCGAKLEAPATEDVEAAPAVIDEAAVDDVAATEATDSADDVAATEATDSADDERAEVVQEVGEAAALEADEELPAAEPIPVSVPEAVAPGAASLQTAKLTVMRGGTVGKEFPLQDGDNLIGRWDPDSGSFPEVDLESDDTEARISRKHALIKFGDKITIEDIGSLNGTFVNRGQRLEPGSPATLKDGDEIIIGKTFFKVAVG